VVANELLDAMPAHIVAWRDEGIVERGVSLDAQGDLPGRSVRRAVRCWRLPGKLVPNASCRPASRGGLAVRAWAAEWGHRLDRGALLLIDYGFPRRGSITSSAAVAR
jgi:SAM-dependent MidA family methyltransferase